MVAVPMPRAKGSASETATQSRGSGSGYSPHAHVRKGGRRCDQRVIGSNSARSEDDYCGGGSSMTLLGSAQHQRLVDP